MQTENTKFAAKITPAQVKEAQAEDKLKMAEKRDDASGKGEKEAHKQPEKTLPQDKKLKPEKKKAKEAKKDEALTFPVSIRINDYGFIGLRKGLLKALDWHKGMTLKLNKNADGSVTVGKA